MSSWRQLQWGCALAGFALILCFVGRWEVLLFAAFIIGLGYGPSTSAGSDLLMVSVPKGRRGIIFSVKQAGVPLGGVFAGLVLPAIALLAGGIGPALIAMAATAMLAAFGLARVQPDLGAEFAQSPRLEWGSLLLTPLHQMKRLAISHPLRTITLAALALGLAQGVLMGFYPVFLSDHAGYSLAGAGAAFALLQAVGVGARVGTGWLADRLGDTLTTLFILCFFRAR
ncbi:MFS transporter [Sulfitobacter sp. 1A12779]|uniref:MFS transporter n=1 Tax=Sulfitobacter sp. 1A12779 TaxID=3368599 RepID=UPI00374962F5